MRTTGSTAGNSAHEVESRRPRGENLGVVLVLTPTLGKSEFLDRTVESVARQTVPVRHVLVVPVGSVASVQARFPHTLVVPDAGPVGGIYGALNAGLAVAPRDWEWFTYINDDDVLLPDFSRLVPRRTDGSTPHIVYGEVDLIDEADTTISGITIERAPRQLGALLQAGISPLMQQGTLFSRASVAKVGEFDLRYRLCADLDFWLRCWVQGHPFTHRKLRVAQFRIRTGQLSGNTALTRAEQDDIVRRHLPVAQSWLAGVFAMAKFRIDNAPKYLKRFRRVGWKRSYALLGNR